MHEKLKEFQDVLNECLELLSPKLRPTVVVRENYEPHNGPGLPVEALIIGDKWAAFPQMWETKPPIAAIRLEELEPYLANRKATFEDPSIVANNANPYSICCGLLQAIVWDYMFPISRAFNKKLFPKKEK